MKCHRIEIVLAVLICFMLAPASLAQDNCPRPRLITVTGTAEVKVAPDEAILRLGVDSHDKALAMAKADNDKHVKKLLGLAREAGVQAKDIQTSALSMNLEYSENQKHTLLGYEVSQSISITLRDVSKYEPLMTSVLQAGVNRVDGVDFLIAEPMKYRADSRAKAIRAAQEKATAMAAELHQTLGKPWEIVDNETGWGALATNMEFSLTKAKVIDESTVAPGEVNISASVKVSFLLE
ncbi:MAG TPA: SIMPL domain-containing protein [Terriglobia bacterium]|nr:SIMPL domain-containing protein [Terriglobia bacterium]